MKNSIKIIGISTLLACAGLSFADTVVFQNGDKLTGQIVSKTETEVVLKTAFGELKIPATALVPQAEAKAAENAEDIAVATSGNTAEKAKANAAEAAPSTAPAAAQEPADKSIMEHFDSWMDDYRKFVHENVPEGWEFKISGAIERCKTTSSTNSYTFAFEAKKKWGESDEFYAKAFYDFASEKNEIGHESTTTDKYGVITNYKHYFDESPWFFSNTLTYQVDFVKGIRDQIDEIAGFGRQFKFLDDTLVINLSVGPALRYINAKGFDDHFVPMGTFIQDLAWNFHKYMRFEESFYAGVSLTNVHNYNYIVTLGLVFDVTDVLDIALRYYYSYDCVNASTAQKSEERITLGFEIPFK